MSEDFSIDLTENQVENIKKAFGLDELEKIHKRFKNGTETIDDIMEHCLNYIMKNEDGIELKVVETKYFDKLIKFVKETQKENIDLKELYIRTAKHQEKIGHVELAEYMLAQIQAVPTFTTWEEYTTWVSKDKIREILKYYEHTPADDPDTTMAFYSDIKKLLEEK